MRETPPGCARSMGANDFGTTTAQCEMVSVRHLFANGKALNYVYDFGDNWELRITLEKVMENYQGPFPYCVAGGGEAGPPEDVGGTGGFMDFLEAWHNPAHPEHSEMIIWGAVLWVLPVALNRSESTSFLNTNCHWGGKKTFPIFYTGSITSSCL